MLIMGVVFSRSDQTSINLTELLYEVKSLSEAETIAKQHDIQLIDYSNYGFATYLVTEARLNPLLELGFEKNQELTRLAPPWTQPLSDPFINEQYAIGMLDLTNAWQLSEGSSEVMIAIIDSGIDTDHEEFIGRISTLSYNSRTKLVGLSHVEDDNGHGTAVAGVIGAIKGNQKGIAGIIQHASLLVIKANNADNTTTEADESDTFSDSSIIEGIRYATAQGADVINLSLGGKSSNSLVQNAIYDARDAGVIVVASSGNFNETNPDTGVPVKIYPASYQGVISVGSVDSNQILSTFSMYNDMVDVVAPGEGIVTTGMDNTYITANGTSFSAPMVAGVIGLMLSYLDGFTDEVILSKLINSSSDLGTIGYDIYYGNGLIDAYQAMLVDYVTVTFVTSGGTLIPDMNVAKDLSFYVNPPIKVGYTFTGWYRDQSLTQLFQMGVDTVSTPTTLYAQFIPNSHTVTYITSGSPINPETVSYDQSFTPGLSTLEGYDFMGWYLEDTYDTLYTGGIITGDLILYAKFEPKQITITYMVNGQIDDVETLSYHQIPTPYIPEGEYPFIGWYIDETFLTLYEPSMIESHLTLYARFDDGQYHVTFYTSDLITILFSTQVLYGESVDSPDGPTKPSSPSFDYVFFGWSQSTSNITQDTEIYPVYTAIYKPESILLYPGVDTLSQGIEHEDALVTASDPLITIDISTNLDIDTPGRYIIRYDVIYEDEIIDTRYRVVHILAPLQEIEISINPDITTLKVGDTYIDQGAVSTYGTVTSTGVVDTSIPGIYEIIYTVTYQDVTYHKIKRIHVLDDVSYHAQPVLYFDDKKGVWMR